MESLSQNRSHIIPTKRTNGKGKHLNLVFLPHSRDNDEGLVLLTPVANHESLVVPRCVRERAVTARIHEHLELVRPAEGGGGGQDARGGRHQAKVHACQHKCGHLKSCISFSHC